MLLFSHSFHYKYFQHSILIGSRVKCILICNEVAAEGNLHFIMFSYYYHLQVLTTKQDYREISRVPEINKIPLRKLQRSLCFNVDARLN